MGKGGKIVVFIIVVFVLVLLATIMKNAGAGAVFSVAAIVIVILYRAMFKKSEPEKNQSEDNEITLKK